MKIQIVDDNKSNLILLSKLALCLEEDIEVETFLDPRLALEACGRTLPDLILVDYLMPDIDGHQFITEVRALPGASDVPIIMVTAADERHVRHRALDLGATDFIAKPVDPIEVKARLRNLLALRRSQLHLLDHNSWLGQEVRKATQALLDREQELILRLAKAAEFRDPETGGHIHRMACYSEQIALRLGLSPEQCQLILNAAPMHDLGKMGIPDDILLKPGKLDDEEFRLMKKHPAMGYSVLQGSSSRLIQLAAVISLSHHEKWDGTGYPNGLAGEEIALAGRIVAVADVFDALTSERPYKHAWSLEQARQFIGDNAGSHFDPRCTQAFLESWNEIRSIHHRFQSDKETNLTPPLDC